MLAKDAALVVCWMLKIMWTNLCAPFKKSCLFDFVINNK